MDFFSLDNIMLVFVALAIPVFISLALIVSLHTRLTKILSKDASSIEETLIALQRNTKDLLASKEKVEKKLLAVDMRLKKNIQGVGTVRFNPFKGTSGSNQSFVVAFLDEKGDGVAISSLYSRERVSVFAKPITHYSSEYELTEEEKEAIARAMRGNS